MGNEGALARDTNSVMDFIKFIIEVYEMRGNRLQEEFSCCRTAGGILRRTMQVRQE